MLVFWPWSIIALAVVEHVEVRHSPHKLSCQAVYKEYVVIIVGARAFQLGKKY